MALPILSQVSGDGCTCGCICRENVGDAIDVVISGITICPCSDVVSFGDFPISMTGVNGVFTAIWDSILGVWKVDVGTVTFQTYADGCVPIGSPFSKTETLVIFCNTTEPLLGKFGAYIRPDEVGPGFIYLFKDETGRDFGDPFVNEFTCASGWISEGGIITPSTP